MKHLHLLFPALLLLAAGCGVAAEDSRPLGEMLHIEAVHTLSPAGHGLSSDATLTWAPPAEADSFFFLLHSGLTIERAEMAGENVSATRLAEGEAIPERLEPYLPLKSWFSDGPHLTLYGLPLNGAGHDSLTLQLRYEGEIFDDVEVPEFSRWEIADETTGLIDTSGAFLLPGTGYYPVLPGANNLTRFTTTIRYPESWEGLTEGNRTERSPGSSSYTSVGTLDGVHLVAGPYTLTEQTEDGLTSAFLHFTDDTEMVGGYIAQSRMYLNRYSGELGPYPYDRFTVVENWFPTGYGMPAYTLLGTEVLRLPFIIHTSLGHEVLHNWWGNSVLVDYSSGNWCEGLTTYQADYAYSASRAPEAAVQYRHDLLRDYADYIVRGDEDDFPLREFTGRTTAGTRTIGYGKAMMVFHMAEQRIGEDAFNQAMRDLYADRQFKVTGWRHFFDRFAEISGQEFDEFEQQWIDRDGAPFFTVHNPIVHRTGGGDSFMLEFDLKQQQDGLPFHLDVPIRLTFSSDSTAEHVLRNVNGEMYHARVASAQRPVRVDIDPDFHLFRVLHTEEAPPTLSGFFGAERVVAVLPGEDDPMRDDYETFARSLLGKVDLEIVGSDELAATELDGRAVLYLGRDDEARKVRTRPALDSARLDGQAELALVWAERNPEQPSVVHANVWAESASALSPLTRKLPHYGKYSVLAFSAGQNIGKGQWEVTDSPLMVTLPGR